MPSTVPEAEFGVIVIGPITIVPSELLLYCDMLRNCLETTGAWPFLNCTRRSSSSPNGKSSVGRLIISSSAPPSPSL
jgi:hypothetical protein